MSLNIDANSAKAMANDARNSEAEKARCAAEFAGLSLEEMEAKSDALYAMLETLKRGSDEWNKTNADIRRIDLAIYAITG